MNSRVISVLRMVAKVCVALALGSAALGCGGSSESSEPVATVSFSPSRSRVAVGSPTELTYRFDVGQNAAISGDYRVFVHVINADGTQMWDDDHDPSVPTSQWKPGQSVQYTRLKFIPQFPYLGEATVKVGLYKVGSNERLPLSGSDPADRMSTSREYKVGTLEILPLTENVMVIYRTGWHPAEVSPDNPTVEWQWTQKRAAMNFQNPRKDIVLYLDYDARPDVFPGQPQTVSVYSGDQVVSSFAADSSAQTLKQIPITVAQLGTGEMADLRIEVDKTFVPSRLPNSGAGDNRELGIRVYHVFIEPK